jgi:hypothetical protein
MTVEGEALAVASRYVSEARRIVAQQQQRIAKLRVAGCLTTDAEQTLQVFLGTLKILEEHERILCSGRDSRAKLSGPRTVMRGNPDFCT